MTTEISFSIVGSGGDGAVAAGDIIAMACASQGLNVIKTEAYGPQIRGGESSCTVRVSEAPLFAQAGALDAIVVFNWKDYARFREELEPADGCRFFHEAADTPPQDITGTLTPIAFKQIAADAKNMVAIGLLASAFGLPLEPIREAIRKRFAKKATAVIDRNLNAFQTGTAQVAAADAAFRSGGSARLLMSGNDAAAFAAIHAGCSFFAGYPITPSTEILQTLSAWLPRIGGTCVQTEDELSAIGAVIGASFAGAKAMTATSGPGLSLMSEMIGLSSIAETPAVIVNVQRGGPSTGIPTKSEQSDLLHAVFGGHGDTPRAVLACIDVEDAFHTTVDAFNIAEEFQLPVVVLSDQSIGQRRETIDASTLTHDVMQRRIGGGEPGYRRYAETADGVSPMSIPGMPAAMYQTNGLEHDEQGRPSSMYVVHDKMNSKRYRKITAIAERYRLYRQFGDESPDLGILCWGSSAGPVREAIDAMRAQGRSAGAFVPRILAPLPAEEMQKFVDSCRRVLVIELSHSGQFHQYLRSQIDLPRSKTRTVARSGGKSLSVSEVLSHAVEEVLA